MSKKIQEKIIDITGVELTPGKPSVCLGNGEQGFGVVVTSVITFCFVFRSLMIKSKKKILLQVRMILKNSKK